MYIKFTPTKQAIIQTFWIKKSCDTKLFLCHSEGQFQVLFVAIAAGLPEVNKVWPAETQQPFI